MNFFKIFDYKLDNGLKLLVVPRYNIPEVSVQLFYNVGSKDETSSEKGVAHLIEHMIFKGTKNLSEPDISLITNKLSGYSNAFTSYDYTGYVFDFPSQHWYEALPIMADCMQNAVFKERLLNSELKSIIQELKIDKDNYTRTLLKNLTTNVFNGHPYSSPVIGYKKNLLNLHHDDLFNFYQKYYVPNNAVLVIVGDVDPNNAYNLTKKHFDKIKPNWNYKKQSFYYSPDLVSKSIVLYRDVKQPIVMLSWIIPGLSSGKDYVFHALSKLLTENKSSVLYKLLITQQQLVSEISSFIYNLFDYDLFIIKFKPFNIKNIDLIIDIINSQINNLINKDIYSYKLKHIQRQLESEYLDYLESNELLASYLGKYYTATHNKNYIFDYIKNIKNNNLDLEIKKFAKERLRAFLVNKGMILPLEKEQKSYWLKTKELSDAIDSKVLSLRKRDTELEKGKQVFNIKSKPPKNFCYPMANEFTLSNGLKVLYYNNSTLPKISLVLDFKAKYYYDPESLSGLCNFVYEMLLEETKNYDNTELTNLLEYYGINISTYPGRIVVSVLSKHLIKALELLKEIVVNSVFSKNSIERVRKNILANINNFCDNQLDIFEQIAKEQVYQSHPYSKKILGTVESVKRITQDDLINFYKEFLSPKGTYLSISGDLTGYNIADILEDTLSSSWQGKEIPNLSYPKLTYVKSKTIDYYINRDQIILGYAGLSVKRDSPDFNKLLILDQILLGGPLGAMGSKLFDLRERTGLFYDIDGTLIKSSGLQPGLVMFNIIVSKNNLLEAQKLIENSLSNIIKSINQEDIEEAKNAIINSSIDRFRSNLDIANTMIYLDIYNLPKDYFDNLTEELKSITINQVQEVATKYLDINKLIIIKVGRLN